MQFINADLDTTHHRPAALSSSSNLILRSMLGFLPLAMLATWLHAPSFLIFILSGLAIIPLAASIAKATEQIADKVGTGLGGLLNATFGNATEMVVAIVALNEGMVEIVKASIAGTIIANLLLAMGAGMLAGGLIHHEQQFQRRLARLHASSLNLALVVLLLPAGIRMTSPASMASEIAGSFTLVSAYILLGYYLLTLVFSMKTHRKMFEMGLAESSVESGQTINGMMPALAQLGISSIALVCASHMLVSSLEATISTLHFSPMFMGVILIPLFGGIVEYITAVRFACSNKVDLTIAVAMGSTQQIAMFVAPVLVILGQVMGQPMNLDFEPFELIAIVIAVLIANSLSGDSRSNWLEGALLLATYGVVCAGFFFHP
ncbi:MAG: calcium/proton exchanger [Pseudomonadota bacterium]|jgi:Ca2+:H+ antiporter